jgi:hypothetical protein
MVRLDFERKITDGPDQIRFKKKIKYGPGLDDDNL